MYLKLEVFIESVEYRHPEKVFQDESLSLKPLLDANAQPIIKPKINAMKSVKQIAKIKGSVVIAPLIGRLNSFWRMTGAGKTLFPKLQ